MKPTLRLRGMLLHCLFIISGILSMQLSCKKVMETTGHAVTIEHNYDIASTCSAMFLEAKKDLSGKPFLYIAAKDAGLMIYAANGSSTPVAVIPVAVLHSLHVMNFSQSGDYLFLALGNHFGTAIQAPGMAIIDVKDPSHPLVKSFWQDISRKGGAGIVETEGNFAYLGAMGNGLMIFDISNKALPVLQSVFIPSIYYPDPKPDPKKFNARGITIRNDLLYLCYDAGGLRILNIADKKHPVEIGKYANPAMNGKPRAYNNVALDDSLALVAFDYCGMEILDISDPSNIKLVSWWNPWNCQSGPLNWFTSNGHCNDIVLDRANQLVFLSSGKSDLQVVDISNPAKPVFKTEYGGVNNRMGTWGVSVSDKNIYLTYVCSFVPFYSNWTGVKVLSYTVN